MYLQIDAGQAQPRHEEVGKTWISFSPTLALSFLSLFGCDLTLVVISLLC